jgi:peptide/nickel transport system permease protein
MAKQESGWASFVRGTKKNLRLYMKSKIGVAGAVVIVFFVMMAILAPYLTSNDPVFGFDVGSPYSIPAWATALPGYHNIPVTYSPVQATFASQGDISGWKTDGQDLNTGFVNGSLLITASIAPNQTIMQDYLAGHPDNPYLPGGQVFFSISKQFQYTQTYPYTFTLDTAVTPLKMTNVSAIYINFIISTPKGNLSMGSVQNEDIAPMIDLPASSIGTQDQLSITSFDLQAGGLPSFAHAPNPNSLIFGSKGTYTLTMQVQAVPVANTTSVSMEVSGITLHLVGGAFGLLGTDNYGRDVWSQLVWGSRVSLEIGVLSGVGAVLLGTLAGLVAGYVGGIWDEILSRITDFFLVIPFLPLLIVLLIVLGQNPVLYKDIYAWIVVIFVVLSWPFIGKLIRSQVLTVKERSYVEASRAVGGGTWHILRRHILPNVMGLIYSQIALNVSAFILLEAALDYLAVSVHPVSTITWGLMLSNALPDAVSNSTASYVWWWFLPPGVCIAAVSLAFVLVGFALDSIFNPRLRAR